MQQISRVFAGMGSDAYNAAVKAEFVAVNKQKHSSH